MSAQKGLQRYRGQNPWRTTPQRVAADKYGKPREVKPSKANTAPMAWVRVTLSPPMWLWKHVRLCVRHCCTSGEMPFLSDSHGPSTGDSLCLPDHRNYASPPLASAHSVGQHAATHLERSPV